MNMITILVVALCAALSALVASVGSFLVWIDGASPAGAVLAGGGTFGGAMALALVVARVLVRGW